MDIDVINLQRSIPIPIGVIKNTTQKAARKLKLSFNTLSIVFVGKMRMRRINCDYLKHDYVTDVITFAHGEIIICPSVAKKNARIFQHSLTHELRLYVVHGLLHLAGFNDHAPQDIKRMREWEEKLL